MSCCGFGCIYTEGGQHQAAALSLVYQAGNEICHVASAVGVRDAPETECFAAQLGISAAIVAGCQQLVVFSDSASVVDSLLNMSPWSRQIFSLDVCKTLHPWFAGDVGHTLTLWHIPSRFEWGVQRRAHDVVTSLRVGQGPTLGLLKDI